MRNATLDLVELTPSVWRRDLPGQNVERDVADFFVSVWHGGSLLIRSQESLAVEVNQVIKSTVPTIDNVTMIYLKEAMQAFLTGCILSSSVMLGVASEHTFNLMLETAVGNPKHEKTFAAVAKERLALRRFNLFKTTLDSKIATRLPPEIREDLDTHFAAILAVIRNFRNESGHPSGKIIEREQAYVLLNLFPSYCKKVYQLRDWLAQ